MAVTVVQSAGTPEEGSTGASLSLPGAITHGNCLVVALTLYSQDGGANTCDGTVSDNATPPNTYIPLTSADNFMTDPRLSWAQRSRWFFVQSATAGSYNITSAIQSATNGNSCWNWISAWEITPAVFDTALISQGGSGADGTGVSENILPGSITPSAAGALLFSLGQMNSGNTAFTDNVGGWVFVQNGAAGGGADWSASKARGAIATETPSFAVVNDSNARLWTAGLLSFIPPPSGVAITASAQAVALATASVRVAQPVTESAVAVALATATTTAPSLLGPAAQALGAATVAVRAPSVVAPSAQALAGAAATVTASLVPLLSPSATAATATVALVTAKTSVSASAQALGAAAAVVVGTAVPFLSPGAVTAVGAAAAGVTAALPVSVSAQALGAATGAVRAAATLAPVAQAVGAGSAAISTSTVPLLAPSAQAASAASAVLRASAALAAVAIASTRASAVVATPAFVAPQATALSHAAGLVVTVLNYTLVTSASMPYDLVTAESA